MYQTNYKRDCTQLDRIDLSNQSTKRATRLGFGFGVQYSKTTQNFWFFNLVKIHAKSMFDSNTYSVDYDNGWQLNIEIVVMACLPIFVVVFTFRQSYLHLSRDSQPHLQPPHLRIRGC